MNIKKYVISGFSFVVVSCAILIVSSKSYAINDFTGTTFSPETNVQVPESIPVSTVTGQRSLKDTYSIGFNLAYSSYSLSSGNLNNLTNQTSSIGYLGAFARYGISEELMLTGEIDYLYGLLSSTISGTTIENSYSGFPISIDLLLVIPMHSFNVYAGVGPVYLSALSIKQKMYSSVMKKSGFGLGGQGILGLETYLSDYSSLGLELRYKHLSLYSVNNAYIAPLNNLTIGLNLIFYI